jgi:hypothetical protein
VWTFPTLEPAIVNGGTFVIDRLLDHAGEVIVRVGDQVNPETIVARSTSEERQMTLFVANELGIANAAVTRHLVKKVGSEVNAGETIARVRHGLRTVSMPAPATGTIAGVDEGGGTIVFAVASGQNQLRALVNGEVERVVPERGAIIRASGSRVFGIVGFGTEAIGPLIVGSDRPDRELTPEQVRDNWKGAVVVCGMTVGVPALHRLRQAGVHGIVVGGLAEADIRRFLAGGNGSAEIPPAAFWSSRHPNAPFSPLAATSPFVIVATEGFGRIPMAEPLFSFLREREGQTVSVHATTSVGDELRRPELYLPGDGDIGAGRVSDELAAGRVVRLTGGRYLGVVGICQTGSYPQLSETGVATMVADVALPGGEVRPITAANLEVLI